MTFPPFGRSFAARSPAILPAARLSVATKLTLLPPDRAESKMTTGTPAPAAAFTGATSALSLSGASTMPDTPCAMNV